MAVRNSLKNSHNLANLSQNMFFPFRKRLHRQISELSVSAILMSAFLLVSFVPQAVDAKVFDFVNLAKFFTSEGQVKAENIPTFPEIGDAEPRNVVLVTMTAYSSDVAQTDSTPCIPADWKYNLCEHYEENGAQDTIATNFLPLGTKVRFPDMYGDKIFTVRDRMNARYGYGRGDLWMPERQLAVDFGVKRIKMEIYYK